MTIPTTCASSRHLTSDSSTDWNQNDGFFKFTRGRFLRDEEYEMSQRRVKPSRPILLQKSKKYPDGLYSKAFLLTMDSGVEVVAKVPNPNAGLAHFTIASEVASMDFVRDICATPAPRVLARSSKASENPVGAEYIIMEKVVGLSLSSVWNSLPIDKKAVIFKQISSYQQAWASIKFQQYGSLYYVADVPTQAERSPICYRDKDDIEVQDSRFAVGPSVSRPTVDFGRAQINFYRGPWSSLEEYCIGTGNREIACVEKIQAVHKPYVSIAGRYIPTRTKKLSALQAYMKLIRFLLPADRSITASHIWHTDLHSENIFVSAEDPTKIVAIIDWQAVALSPLYENTMQPALLEFEGSPLNGLERPEKPQNLNDLEPTVRKAVFANWMDKTLASYYRTLVYHTHPKLYQAIQFREIISYDLLAWARNILIDSEVLYLKQVVHDLKSAWSTLPGVEALKDPPYPFKFSPEEETEIMNDYEDMSAGIEFLNQIREAMGPLFPDDKTIEHQDYDTTKDVLEFYKRNVLQEFARNDEERAAVLAWWPYDS
ncbi:phosphotransferase enzyme family protein [Halenospora varia]|nr:phosphotransferase enzyme family protein [Halenospora varia]